MMEMRKEVDLFTNMISKEDDTVDVDNDDDDDDESERCGICMEMVVDRGLLDCCHDWFCFVCIDNWAPITNLCPFCQHEFQLITFIPLSSLSLPCLLFHSSFNALPFHSRSLPPPHLMTTLFPEMMMIGLFKTRITRCLSHHTTLMKMQLPAWIEMAAKSAVDH